MFDDIKTKLVVPLVGTWIEIIGVRTGFTVTEVVPLVGTWIEII